LLPETTGQPQSAKPKMKNIKDVLREKEAELRQLEKEVEVLRLAVSLLGDQSDTRSRGACCGPRLEQGPSAAIAVAAPVPSPEAVVSSLLLEEHCGETSVSGTTTSRQFP
jgi:hypothetical protein